MPSLPADGSAVDALRPTFAWQEATSPAGIERYEIHAQPGDIVVATAPGGSTDAAAAVDLPDDASLTWYVVAVDGAGASQSSATHALTIATPPIAPTITSGPFGVTGSGTPTFTWTGGRFSSSWEVTGPGGALVAGGASPTASGEATVGGGMPDGAYTFRVAQQNVLGLSGPPSIREFVVDTAPPAALAVTSPQPRVATLAARSFTWRGLEPGAQAQWRLLSAGGTVVGVTAATGGASVGPLPPGSYVFQARQVDPAGNAGPWADVPFAVLPDASSPRPVASGGSEGNVGLPSSNWRRLMPRRGATITSRRPVLRWKRGPSRTTVYNVQVFRVRSGGRRLQKVHSSFPRRARLRLSSRARLARGACYVWRVWPFLGSRAAARPLGVSHFCVRRR